MRTPIKLDKKQLWAVLWALAWGRSPAQNSLNLNYLPKALVGRLGLQRVLPFGGRRHVRSLSKEAHERAEGLWMICSVLCPFLSPFLCSLAATGCNSLLPHGLPPPSSSASPQSPRDGSRHPMLRPLRP